MIWLIDGYDFLRLTRIYYFNTVIKAWGACPRPPLFVCLSWSSSISNISTLSSAQRLWGPPIALLLSCSPALLLLCDPSHHHPMASISGIRQDVCPSFDNLWVKIVGVLVHHMPFSVGVFLEFFEDHATGIVVLVANTAGKALALAGRRKISIHFSSSVDSVSFGCDTSSLLRPSSS